MRQLRDKLTYANVMSTICFVLLVSGGAAYAATQLGKNSVGTKQIKKNAIVTSKIKNEAVTGAKVKNGAVTAAKIPNGSLTGTQINASHAWNGAHSPDGAICSDRSEGEHDRRL